MYFQRPRAFCSYNEREVLVNNFTDINKTNNYFSPQFIEYKKTTKYADGTRSLLWTGTKNDGDVNLLIVKCKCGDLILIRLAVSLNMVINHYFYHCFYIVNPTWLSSSNIKTTYNEGLHSLVPYDPHGL